MMYEPKRLHPLTILLEMLSTVKELFIPIVLFVFIGGRGDDSFFGKIPSFILLGLIAFQIIYSIISWFRFTYWLEDQELRIEQGLFVRKKRYIPFERIQSINLSENILHRPFQLAKVQIETAGSSQGESEAELTAIKKEQALALQKIIAEAKSAPMADDVTEDEVPVSNEEVIYKITPGQLFFLASTSGRAGVVISAFLAFTLQFEQFIPYDKIFSEMQEVIRFGVLFISVIILIILFIAWLISVLIAFFKYNDFTVKKVKDDLVITRGLIEKRTTTVPLHRIQGIKITESPMRQPFGYASVSLENAGGSMLELESASITLIPVVKRRQIGEILGNTLEEYEFDHTFERPPKRAVRRYMFIKVMFTIIVTAILTGFFWPYGLFASFLILGAMIWGYTQYKSAGWQVSDQQLTMRYRDIQQHTMFMKKNRIQSLEMHVTWFQRRAKLAGIDAVVKSGDGLQLARIPHLDERAVFNIYSWYRHKESPIISENE